MAVPLCWQNILLGTGPRTRATTQGTLPGTRATTQGTLPGTRATTSPGPTKGKNIFYIIVFTDANRNERIIFCTLVSFGDPVHIIQRNIVNRVLHNTTERQSYDIYASTSVSKKTYPRLIVVKTHHILIKERGSNAPELVPSSASPSL